MNSNNTHDNAQLIDRYLNNKMSDAERTAFEINYMQDTQLLEQLQLTEALKQGLSAHRQALITPGTTTILSFGSWLRQPISMAASLLLAVMGAQLFYPGQPSDNRATGVLPIATTVLLEGSRGAAGYTIDGSSPYLFQIDAGFGNTAETFTVTLREAENGQSLIEQAGLTQDVSGWVKVVINTTLAGDYSLELGWQDAQGAQQLRSFPVSVNN